MDKGSVLISEQIISVKGYIIICRGFQFKQDLDIFQMGSYIEKHQTISDPLENSLNTLISFIKESCELTLKTPFLLSAEKYIDIGNAPVVSCINTFKIDNTHSYHLILKNLSIHTTSKKNINMDRYLLQKLTVLISEGIVNNFSNEIRLITSSKLTYINNGFLANCLLKHQSGLLNFYLIRFIPV